MRKNKVSRTSVRYAVLVVDDNEDERELYAEYLRSAGYTVETATSGDEAVAMALNSLPSVIVMDLLMPKLDGLETARILRSYEKTKEIPIIACTGLSDDATAALAKDAGCDVVLIKPCVPEDLQEAIRSLLNDALEEEGEAQGNAS